MKSIRPFLNDDISSNTDLYEAAFARVHGETPPKLIKQATDAILGDLAQESKYISLVKKTLAKAKIRAFKKVEKKFIKRACLSIVREKAAQWWREFYEETEAVADTEQTAELPAGNVPAGNIPAETATAPAEVTTSNDTENAENPTAGDTATSEGNTTGDTAGGDTNNTTADTDNGEDTDE